MGLGDPPREGQGALRDAILHQLVIRDAVKAKRTWRGGSDDEVATAFYKRFRSGHLADAPGVLIRQKTGSGGAVTKAIAAVSLDDPEDQAPIASGLRDYAHFLLQRATEDVAGPDGVADGAHALARANHLMLDAFRDAQGRDPDAGDGAFWSAFAALVRAMLDAAEVVTGEEARPSRPPTR